MNTGAYSVGGAVSELNLADPLDPAAYAADTVVNAVKDLS